MSAPVPVNQGVTLSVEEVEALPGAEICVDVKVAGFENLLAMQYSMNWDAAVLSFTGHQSYHLPGLGEQNFGTHRTGQGVLTFVWLDNSLQGVTLPDGSAIYQLCFEVRGKSGQRAAIRFSPDPTPIEAVNLAEELISFTGKEGGVVIP